MTRFLQWLEYRRNRRIAKRELAKIMSTTLPVVRKVSTSSADIATFALELINTCKGLSGEALVDKLFGEASLLLETTQPRLLEIISYMANLSAEEMQKIVTHSIVHSNPEIKNDEE